jgi:hypothetical protein
MASVVHGYLRITRLWEAKATPAPQPGPQPELAV